VDGADVAGRGHLALRPTMATWVPTIVAAVLSVVALVVVANVVYGSFHPSIDQATYAAQADALRDGHLTIPDTGGLPLVFTAPTDEGLVAKYLPGTAALGAVSEAVGAGTWLATGASLVLVVVATSGIAAEAGLGPRSRALAGLLVGLSPCILALDARLLSYVPGVAVATAAVWIVLAGVRLGRTGLIAVAGLVLGAALMVRQLEVVTWVVVLVAWLAVTAGSRAVALRRAGALVAAIVPGVVLVALYDLAVTGSAGRLPYVLVSPDDGPGFGLRRALVTDPYFDFDLVGGVRALTSSPGLLVTWIALGPLVALGALLALRRPARPRIVALLVGLAVSVPLVFVVQWSHKNALRGGHYDTIGPFYLLFAVPPLVVLGVVGWRAVARRWPTWVRAALVVACVAVQVGLLWSPLQRQLELDDAWERFDREVAALGEDGPALVLVEEAQRRAQFPELSIGGEAVAVSVPSVPDALAVLDGTPGRDVRLATQQIQLIDGRLLPVPRLDPVEVARVGPGSGAVLELRAAIGCPDPGAGVGAAAVIVHLGGEPAATVDCGAGDEVALFVGTDAVELRADGVTQARAALPEGPSSVALCAAPTGLDDPPTACRHLAVSRAADATTVLLPGQLDADAAVKGMGDVVGPLRPVQGSAGGS
jgi:hypothetical protein